MIYEKITHYYQYRKCLCIFHLNRKFISSRNYSQVQKLISKTNHAQQFASYASKISASAIRTIAECRIYIDVLYTQTVAKVNKPQLQN